jgi:hypothetical protein
MLPLYCTKCRKPITLVCRLGPVPNSQAEKVYGCPVCDHAIPATLRRSVIRVWAGHGSAPR